tara:strand:- start:498 stop:1796 length:1299 start_codon:yes stop_codon:yes gene_type:complete
MKKVLIITYYWPPSGGSGVQRWMYFTKYLSEFNYKPFILTVSEKYASYKTLDKSFVEKVKDVEVYKTRTLEPLRLYSFLNTGSLTKGIPQGTINKSKRGFFFKLSSIIRGNFFIPDARIGWNFFALKKARKIIVMNGIDMVITTGPPHSTHLIGLQLKKEYSIKWISDFRDPWTDIYYNEEFNRSKWSIKKDSILEKKVLESADIVLTVGSKLKQLLQNKISTQLNKFHHIYNGYDSFLMKKIEKEIHSFFEITFIGLLTENQPFLSFIESFKIFLTKSPNPNIQICLAGDIHPEILKSFEELPVTVNYKGYVSHEDALRLMKRSELLLNILAEMKNSDILISGKQMEYIATGNPILCIGNTKGESAFLIKDISNARIFEKDQINNISEFISKVYSLWESNESFLNDVENDFVIKKSRFETSLQLSQLLNSI